MARTGLRDKLWYQVTTFVASMGMIGFGTYWFFVSEYARATYCAVLIGLMCLADIDEKLNGVLDTLKDKADD